MASDTLTARGVAAIRPAATETIHWDGKLKGFGLRVLPTGAKSWIILYRVPTRRWARKMTIGTYPKLSLGKARKRAKGELSTAALGHDPAVAKQETRESVRHTAGALFKAYAEQADVRHEAGEFRSWPDVKRSLERDVLSEWATRPVAEIRRRDVMEVVTRKAKAGPTAANRLQAHISMLFAYGVEADWLPANPAAGLRKRREQPRDRVLSTDELRDLWRYLDADTPIALSRGKTPDTRIEMPAETGETLRHVFKLLLVAGQRLGETSRMKWADVDLDAKRWTIPATETKNRTVHQVPLSEPAVELLQARSETAHPLGTYVFPSSAKSDASAWVWTKRTAAALATATGIAFTAHDLRRTVATMMGELGIEADTIGLVLNHRKPGVTTRHYDHSTRETAKRAALDRWAQRLAQIVTETPAKVTPIRARA
jgi:integrase